MARTGLYACTSAYPVAPEDLSLLEISWLQTLDPAPLMAGLSGPESCAVEASRSTADWASSGSVRRGFSASVSRVLEDDSDPAGDPRPSGPWLGRPSHGLGRGSGRLMAGAGPRSRVRSWPCRCRTLPHQRDACTLGDREGDISHGLVPVAVTAVTGAELLHLQHRCPVGHGGCRARWGRIGGRRAAPRLL